MRQKLAQRSSIVRIFIAFIIVGSVIFMTVPTNQADAATDFFTGTLDGSEPSSPLLFAFCEGGYEEGPSEGPEGGPYDLVGPYVAPVSGAYYYTDISIEYALDIQVAVTTSASDPFNNLLTVNDGYAGPTDVFDDYGDVYLNAGTTYYFIVQGLCNWGVGDWEFSIAYAIAPQPAPQIGMIMISVAQAQPVYDSAAGNIVRDAGGHELWLPQDFDGNGFDTHLVISTKEINGQTWYQIWIGDGANLVWVPADNVTVIE